MRHEAYIIAQRQLPAEGFFFSYFLFKNPPFLSGHVNYVSCFIISLIEKRNHIDPKPHNDNLTHWRKKSLENIVGKEENAGNQHFLLF